MVFKLSRELLQQQAYDMHRLHAVLARNGTLRNNTVGTQTQNLKSGSTSIAQKNFVTNVLLNIFSMGTSFRLHHATVIRGSK